MARKYPPRIIKDCPQCGTEFSVPPSLVRIKNCSKDCYDKSQTGLRRDINCATCGESFQAKQDHGKWQRFCGRACFESQVHHSRNARCEKCGVKFRSVWRAKRAAYSKYCGAPCYTKVQTTRIAVDCGHCGKEFLPPKWRADKHDEVFCSVRCHAEKMCGKNSPSYKGGSYVSSAGVRFIAQGNHVAKVGYKGEHRLVVERLLGRKLKHWSEPILHINRDKLDNRIENLYLCKDMSEMGSILQGRAEFPQHSNLP